MIKMMTTLNRVPDGAVDAFRVILGKVEEDYTWQKQLDGTFRPLCATEGHGLMSWAMRIDPRYGLTPNKHTLRNGANVVEYLGRPVQMWHCKACALDDKQNWVVK